MQFEMLQDMHVGLTPVVNIVVPLGHMQLPLLILNVLSGHPQAAPLLITVKFPTQVAHILGRLQTPQFTIPQLGTHKLALLS